MKTKITIDWDSETREALVQINDRQPRTWVDCDLSILKEVTQDSSRRVVRERVVLERTVS